MFRRSNFLQVNINLVSNKVQNKKNTASFLFIVSAGATSILGSEATQLLLWLNFYCGLSESDVLWNADSFIV